MKAASKADGPDPESAGRRPGQRGRRVLCNGVRAVSDGGLFRLEVVHINALQTHRSVVAYTDPVLDHWAGESRAVDEHNGLCQVFPVLASLTGNVDIVMTPPFLDRRPAKLQWGRRENTTESGARVLRGWRSALTSMGPS